MLETFQLINRQLTVLPDELRGCRDHKFISIVNCAIEELPVWAKEFQNLEFLQIEDKVGSDNLGNLASDLFTNMPELRYLQLGLHQRMAQLPPLDGVPNLCCIILARMNGITELPSLARVSQLERMEVIVMNQLAISSPSVLSFTLQFIKEHICAATDSSTLVTSRFRTAKPPHAYKMPHTKLPPQRFKFSRNSPLVSANQILEPLKLQLLPPFKCAMECHFDSVVYQASSQMQPLSGYSMLQPSYASPSL